MNVYVERAQKTPKTGTELSRAQLAALMGGLAKTGMTGNSLVIPDLDPFPQPPLDPDPYP